MEAERGKQILSSLGLKTNKVKRGANHEELMPIMKVTKEKMKACQKSRKFQINTDLEEKES
jgi:hypothetical protein